MKTSSHTQKNFLRIVNNEELIKKEQKRKNQEKLILEYRMKIEQYTKNMSDLGVVIDLDGVLAEERADFDFAKYRVYAGAVEWVNFLYDMGFTIKIDSCRFEVDRGITEQWLADCGFKYHYLYMGKPKGILYVSTEGHNFKDWKNVIGELRETINFLENEKL